VEGAGFFSFHSEVLEAGLASITLDFTQCNSKPKQFQPITFHRDEFLLRKKPFLDSKQYNAQLNNPSRSIMSIYLALIGNTGLLSRKEDQVQFKR
jgi:hypothetical protein